MNGHPPRQFIVAGGGGNTEHFAASFKCFCPFSIRKQAEMADAHEAVGQDVHEEAADEFHGGQGHGFAGVAMSVVDIGKRDVCAIECDNTVFSYCDAMGIASEVLDDGFGGSEGGFQVDDPVFAVQCIDECRSFFRMFPFAEPAVKTDFVFGDCVSEVFHEFALVHLLQDGNGGEEITAAMLPAQVFGPQASGGYDAVQVWMIVEVLPPGVQHGDTADSCAEPFVLEGKLLEGIVCGTVEDIVYGPLITQCKGVQLGGDGKNDVEVRDGQHFVYACLYPEECGITLASRAVAVSAGMEMLLWFMAAITFVVMCSEAVGAACEDSVYGPEVPGGQCAVSLQVRG